MRINEMSAVLFLMICCFVLSLNANALVPASVNTVSTDECLENFVPGPRGNIVILDDILKVDTEDTSDPVDVILIYSGGVLIEAYHGCTSSECDMDISHLAAGTYTVVVHTDSGYSFSDTFVIR